MPYCSVNQSAQSKLGCITLELRLYSSPNLTLMHFKAQVLEK